MTLDEVRRMLIGRTVFDVNLRHGLDGEAHDSEPDQITLTFLDGGKITIAADSHDWGGTEHLKFKEEDSR